MPATINPRNKGVRAGQILSRGRELRENGPPLPAPGMPRGYVRMLMEARIRPPGEPAKTKLVWVHCKSHAYNDPCTAAGPILVCGRCWETDKVVGDVWIVGPLDAALGVICKTCGGIDLEVVGHNEPTEDPRIPGRLYYSPETHQLEEWQ